MFWAKARKTYADVTADDPDVRKFLELSDSFQKDVYKGIAGAIQDLGHHWVAARTPSGRVLEIGYGSGRHSLFVSKHVDDYFASEYSSVHAGSPLWESMRGRTLRCDARKLPFPPASFTAVISIYNLEHISDLTSVFAEVHRVLLQNGRFLIALPCEGGFLWNLGRELGTRPFFEKRYGINYDKVIAYEHVWDYRAIYRQLAGSGLFRIAAQRFFPSILPLVDCNLVACLECVRV